VKTTPAEDRILEHYKNPYHRQRCDNFDEATFFVTGMAKNESCDDWVRWWGRLSFDSEKRIMGLWWEGEGCVFSQVMPSMLAEHCEAKRLAEVEAFTQDDMLSLFGIDVASDRIGCVMLAYQALQETLRSRDD
jgi:NifU-like protein involved in Fe-S cluster formation